VKIDVNPPSYQCKAAIFFKVEGVMLQMQFFCSIPVLQARTGRPFLL